MAMVKTSASNVPMAERLTLFPPVISKAKSGFSSLQPAKTCKSGTDTVVRTSGDW